VGPLRPRHRQAHHRRLRHGDGRQRAAHLQRKTQTGQETVPGTALPLLT